MIQDLYLYLRRNLVGVMLVVGFALHMWHIGVDLPNNYYVDEPHHLNKAASFGSGNLNPHDFKYPTLWSYTLAGMLGGLYAMGSMLGLVASKMDFAQKYFYNPGFFFFCGRTLSTFFIWLVALVFYRLGLKYYSKPFAIFSCFLALISSMLSDFGLQAVPYSMLVFFAACALFPLHELLEGGGLTSTIKLGLFIGLAVSSHYVAVPFVSLFLISFIKQKEMSRKVGYFLAALLAAGVGFFIGTPFLLVELKSYVTTILGFLVGLPFLHAKAASASAESSVLSNINAWKLNFMWNNLFHFMDLWGVGFVLMVVGVISELKEKRWRVLLWILPYVSALPILLLSFFGTAERYTILLGIPFFIPAAQGFFYLRNLLGVSELKKKFYDVVICGLFIASFIVNRLYITIPDTRTIAQDWINKNIPAGEKILLPGPYEGPPLLMSKIQVERLYQKTRELKHPREMYYNALLYGHPGGGYEIFFVKKSVEEILDLPYRTERSFQAQEFIDVMNEGIKPLITEGVYWVVILKKWETYDRHKKWIEALRSNFKLVATFEPSTNKVKGYWLEIYHYDGE